jgi:hypothetical protein
VMDEATIRRQLAEFENRLSRMDDERQALLDIVKGYQTLLRTMAMPDYESAEPPDFPPGRTIRPTSIPPAISMRSAVARVLREAGAPIHSKEILARVQALGASTTAKEPVSVVDLVVLGLQQRGKVEKVGPRTWRWIAEG